MLRLRVPLSEAGLSPTTGQEQRALTLWRAGIAALVVSIGAGMTSNLLFLAAFQFRLDMFLEPTLILGSGAISAELLRWAAVLDLLGYYLATAVLAYVLWRQLRPRNPLIADLSTLAAVGYALAGGLGAAVLAMVVPMLMHIYTDTTAAGQTVIAAQFATVLQVVWRSIWQFLDAILLAAWWLGIGRLLRQDHPRLSRLSLILAAGRRSRWRRQRRGAKSRARCSARHALPALDRMVDLAACGIRARITSSFPRFPDVTTVRLPRDSYAAGRAAATSGIGTPALGGGSIMRLPGFCVAAPNGL